ncbi:MAG: cytochrome c oxidase accessory protein CcoG [Burkholderiales bacterium]
MSKPAVDTSTGFGGALFESHRKVYPRAVTGWFAAWRWLFVWLTQLIFYGLPWLALHGRQAVLFDIDARKFYLFDLVLWPQDVIYLAVLLVLCALALFLFTAVAGRLWCGFACPQTVYTEIFLWVERVIEGDRDARMRLDAAGNGARKIALKAAKHFVWIALSLWTGFTFVGYFTPIRTLAMEISTASLGPWEAFWVFFYAFATYGNAGWMREQVCKYMCPYARFQSAMFDRDTLIITYDQARGEPRGRIASVEAGGGRRAKGVDPRTVGLGDCIDCGVCVQVCPTGIDIRDGLQYECIGCTACIDGCNHIMDRMGYARGLIRYSTEAALQTGASARQIWARVLRPRVLVYSILLGLITLAAAFMLVTRVPLKVDVIRDRGFAREVEGGRIENVYRLQIMNVTERSRQFSIAVRGIDSVTIDSATTVTIPAATNQGVPTRVRIDAARAQSGSQRIEFEVTALDDPSVRVVERAVLLVPR